MSTIETVLEDQKAEVANRVAEAYATQGYANDTDPTGKAALALAVLAILVKAKVSDPRDLDSKAVSKAALGRKAFSKIPGSQPGDLADLDEIATLVWKRLEAEAWNLTAPYSGIMQKMVGASCKGFVLTRGEATIEAEGTTVDVAYVTDSEPLLLKHFAKPLQDRVTQASAKLANQLAMVSARQPGLAARMTREVSQTTGEADRTAKSIMALAAPSSE